jgi:large subunit ribosomal protein L25
VTEKTRVNVEIPVRFVDEENSRGLRRGGVLNIVRHEIEVYAAAGNIPDEIVVSLAGKDINDSIHISEVALPDGVTPTITDRDFTIATIAAPTTVAEEQAAEQAEAEMPDYEDGEEAEGEEGEAEGDGDEKKDE